MLTAINNQQFAERLRLPGTTIGFGKIPVVMISFLLAYGYVVPEVYTIY